MKKIRKRVFAAVLVALMLVTAIPSTALLHRRKRKAQTFLPAREKKQRFRK